MPVNRPRRNWVFPALAVCLLLVFASPLHGFSKQHPGPACVPLATAIASPPANPPSTSSTSPNQDICIQAHIYEVVELTDGTRFLDVCPPATSDTDCRFLLMSLNEDRDEVGDLSRFRNRDVQIRGTIRIYRGRFGMKISHARQFDGGPEKFRPNPKLLHDFNGQSDRMPVRDPALRSSGRHRSFMDRNDREELPAEKKP